LLRARRGNDGEPFYNYNDEIRPISASKERETGALVFPLLNKQEGCERDQERETLNLAQCL